MPAIVQTAATPPAPDRTARFMRRVEEHLEGLARSERLPFLLGQRTAWIARSERFAESVDRGCYDDVPDAPTIWDYTFTIMALDRRIAEERRHG